MKILTLGILLVLGVGNLLPAQNFLNGDLNGTVAVSSSPTSWSQVPYTDPLSIASGTSQATSDVTGPSGPAASSGISGNPCTGTTFVSGLLMSMSGMQWQEGLQQTVSGLVIGDEYRITFWQSVVQQSNATDNSGSWAVYANSTLLGISAPTMTFVAYNNNNLLWEQRSITFTASATSLTFKFLPRDDDANWAGNAGIRMGIDNINLVPTAILAPEFDFSLQVQSGAVLLNWDTDPSSPVIHYQVMRSVDGIQYETLETLEVVDGRLSMEFTDFRPMDHGYYQVSCWMQDGSVRYSQVHAARLEPPLKATLVKRNLSVWGGSATNFRVTLVDLNGAQVLEQMGSGDFDLSRLQSGIYILQVSALSDNPQMISQKILLTD